MTCWPGCGVEGAPIPASLLAKHGRARGIAVDWSCVRGGGCPRRSLWRGAGCFEEYDDRGERYSPS